MFTYQMHPRTLYLESGARPTLPALATFELTLQPSHLFGEGIGDLPLLIPERGLNAEWSGLTGRAVHTHNPPITPFALQASFLKGQIILNGSTVRHARECQSIQECASILETMRLAVPAVLALFLPRPVIVSSASVSIDSSRLVSHLSRGISALEYTTEQAYVDRVGNGLLALILSSRTAITLCWQLLPTCM